MIFKLVLHYILIMHQTFKAIATVSPFSRRPLIVTIIASYKAIKSKQTRIKILRRK